MTRRLPHGEVIVRQGDAVSSLFLVTAGHAALRSVERNPHAATLA